MSSATSKKIAVLGGGRVGSAMVRDLAAHDDLQVTLADLSTHALDAFTDDPRVNTVAADLSDAETVANLAAAHDLVVGAVPGPMGFATARTVLEQSTSLVDISFFEEDAFELDALARDAGVPALIDCGVAPGASNLILGHMEATLERVHSFACCVGGLPERRRWPYEYKAPFSPIDVIAEYTRPVRLREAGKEVVRPALGRPERLDLPGVGTLEAFETDGLRTLLKTSDVPNLSEKTLRYPGHRELMEVLRHSGFFGEQPVTLADGTTVRPVDLSAKLLFEQWRLEPEEPELTVMRIDIIGKTRAEDGRISLMRHRFDLLDRYDAATATSSMARTTGYTCTAMVRLLVDGLYDQAGITPPEIIGRDRRCFDHVMTYLSDRGIVFDNRVESCDRGRLA